MKSAIRRHLRLFLFVAFCCLFRPASANVSITLDFLHAYNFYYASTSLTATNPAPVTYHRIESPNGLIWRNHGTNNDAKNFPTTNSLAAVIDECTNGLWKLYLNKEDATETVFYFSVAITNLSTNVFGEVVIDFPMDGSSGITNLPTFQFTGPTNLPSLTAQVYDDPGFASFYSAFLPGTATNWTPSGPLASGPNVFSLFYRSNNYPGVAISVPTNSLGTDLSGWTSQSTVESYRFSFFDVAQPGTGGHTLRAHYSFEDDDIFATDFSGNGNDVTSIASSGGGTRYTTNSPALGNHAAYFDNNGGSGAGFLPAPTNLLSALAGSFTVSLWVQTTQVFGNDTDSGLSNPGIVAAFNGPGGNWVVPMALTGSKVGFATGGSLQTTLNSTASMTNESQFVHVVVTRDQNTGEKKIYIDGSLDSSEIGSTDSLNSPTDLYIGYNNGKGFTGVMDEIQFYSGVLSASEVAFLYNNPGSTVPNVGGSALGEAVEAPQLPWTTGGDADWFPQTDETDDGIDAAQSGAIDHDQSTWIETTVQGPGILSFFWNVSSDDFDSYDHLELTIDDNYEADIAGEWGWDYYEVELFDSGPHTIRWTYYKDSDFTAGSDAAWLDEVYFDQRISVSLNLTIQRSVNGTNEGYTVFPYLSFVEPEATTTHEVESPNGLFSGDESSSSSTSLSTLEEVIDECEAGDWSLYINRGAPNERQFYFTVTVNSLDTNDLPMVEIISPAQGATGVATNPVFQWSGPAGFSTLYVSDFLIGGGIAGSENLSVGATSWTHGPVLMEGTNRFNVVYQSNGFSGIDFSEPEDSLANPLSSWSTFTILDARAFSDFVVGGSVEPQPATLLTPLVSGTNFTFSFLTQPGLTHFVESTTNVVTGPWQVRSNLTGSGSNVLIELPIGDLPLEVFRVRTE